jgi:hypothetical protein
MKRLALMFAISALPLCGAHAADSCKAQAALTSFMKKCEIDAKAACDKQAALLGAAKDSFTKKCVTDATGA